MKRIGLIGAGWVTEHHLDAYRKLSAQAQVVAIADPSEAARESRAAQYAIPRTYADAGSMLQRERLDAVDIAVPRAQHVQVCRLAADHGLPILCQKPLAPTLGEARSLACELDGRVRLMVHENWRFRPHYRKIRQWLTEEITGRTRNVIMTVLTSGLIRDSEGRMPAVERQPFFATEPRLLLMEVLIHHIDTLRYLFGDLVLGAAKLGKSNHSVRGEDRAALMLTTSQGGAVTLVGDFMAHGYPAAQFDRLEVLGETGAIRLAGTRLDLIGAHPQTHELDLDVNYQASYHAAIRHFLDRLDDGLPFETCPDDNLKTLELVERAYQSG